MDAVRAAPGGHLATVDLHALADADEAMLVSVFSGEGCLSLIGIALLLFLPETKGRPLPE